MVPSTIPTVTTVSTTPDITRDIASVYPVREHSVRSIIYHRKLDWISYLMSNTLLMSDLTNTLPMDDNTNMTYNSTQVIDMSFTNISIAGNSTNTDTRQLANYEIAQLVLFLLVLPILGVFGIVGNILSFVVLGRDDVMKKTTRFLLRNLAAADIGFLIMLVFQNAWLTIIYKVPQYSSPQIDQLFWSMVPYLWFIAEAFHVASIYSVVIVTGDRYIAICRPLQSGRLSTTRNARWAVAAVWCAAVIFSIPLGMRNMTIPCDNATSGCYRSSMSLYKDRVYNLVYHVILVNIVEIMIPLTVLITLNVKLIKAVRASRQIHSETQRQQNNTTVMLVTIVITFSICFTPLLLYSVIWTWQFTHGINVYVILYYNYMLSNMFLAVNSAANFLIYLARGERFRRILANICLLTKIQ